MPAPESALEPVVTPPAAAPALVAPPREKRLVPVTVPAQPRPVRATKRAGAAGGSPPAVKPVVTSAVECKVAALRDPEEILNVMQTEVALRRAQRLSGAGDSQRQMMRLLSVCMLFALLVAAVGAMWYLQTLLQGSTHKQRVPPAPVTTSAPARR